MEKSPELSVRFQTFVLHYVSYEDTYISVGFCGLSALYAL